MARGDVYLIDVPENIGPHFSVVLRERNGTVVVIFGQTQGYPGAHKGEPADAVAREFGASLVRATHFHKNNLAVVPAASLRPPRLGHIDDDDLPSFEKAARPGFAELGRIVDALQMAGHRCQCQGGCKKHQPPCPRVVNPATGHSLMDWRLTPSKRVVCRSCWDG